MITKGSYIFADAFKWFWTISLSLGAVYNGGMAIVSILSPIFLIATIAGTIVWIILFVIYMIIFTTVWKEVYLFKSYENAMKTIYGPHVFDPPKKMLY